jgi:hypothetical protein
MFPNSGAMALQKCMHVCHVLRQGAFNVSPASFLFCEMLLCWDAGRHGSGTAAMQDPLKICVVVIARHAAHGIFVHFRSSFSYIFDFPAN